MLKTTEHILETPKGPIVYQHCGHGPPLLLLHGFLGRPQDFRWILPALSQHFELFLPELPGMVSTDLGEHEPLSQSGMASFVKLFLDSLEIEQCGIISHSMGSGVAISFASKYAPRVQKLGLISPVGPRIHRALSKTRPDIGHILLRSPFRRLVLPIMRYVLRKMGFPKGVRDEAIINSMWFNSMFDYQLYSEMIASLQMPTFLTYTMNDPQIQTEIFEEMSALLPSVQTLIFENGGHNPQKHHCDTVAEEMLKHFLEIE